LHSPPVTAREERERHKFFQSITARTIFCSVEHPAPGRAKHLTAARRCAKRREGLVVSPVASAPSLRYHRTIKLKCSSADQPAGLGRPAPGHTCAAASRRRGRPSEDHGGDEFPARSSPRARAAPSPPAPGGSPGWPGEQGQGPQVTAAPPAPVKPPPDGSWRRPVRRSWKPAG
jgi:hypothetical protein